VGNGWYASYGGSVPDEDIPRVVAAKLVVDGEEVKGGGGGGWRSHESPLVYDSIYNGVIYDARLEPMVSYWCW